MSILIDTRTVGPFTVNTYALPEDLDPRDSFDECILDDVIDGIDSGRYEWFCAQVTAEWEGIELASDYIGGCCYDSFEQFANGQGYHADMIRNVTEKAGTRLREIADKALATLAAQA